MKVLILSIAIEKSTNKVISWIGNIRVVKRINSKTNSINEALKILDLKFSFWYRRGNFKISFPPIENSLDIKLHLGLEEERIQNHLHFMLKNKACYNLGYFFDERFNNKLNDLITAMNIGLSTPNWAIITSKLELKTFLKNFDKVITKPFSNPLVSIKDNNQITGSGTKIVDPSILNIVRDNFFPSFVQEYIEKKFELRIFYLKGVFYSMAIFSQLSKSTNIDYRNIDREKPNRNVPYKLPKDIEAKLEAFMQKSELDTGSIDMIVTPNNEYVFLEVNPVGQFDWLSVNCNYYVEEKIAQYLAYGKIEDTNSN